ncbi:NPCC-domain-containing protein [Phialemonium atrogriseum]|uniref:NPCC-domain-containing protein n=1 Tax=Phialemonium atrogriseum TaxID=1093897 RepID=A0AAJ0FL21_9PEZI|nr:NPCC-domain-containing protein [Phialemonium atrogriseum]KAK1766214.1 NPCC-domain-containing protein [Phialemonium atrogriseum]
MPPSKLAMAPAKHTTPVKRAPVVTDSPGNWKHPRLAEITRRQGRTVFSEKNVKTIAYNFATLTLLWVLGLVVKLNVPSGLLNASLKAYISWGYMLLQAIPLVNIALALLPLARRQDDLSDIPLTPAQRKLLGLPPNSAPPTPNSAYSTPPRYSRTPSLAGSAASNKSYNSSPLSGNGSPASERRHGGSPYSPASPLLQKAVTGGMGGARRPSFGSASPLGASTAASLFGDSPGTPSPAGGKRSSVGLNNKWLYEKGRRTSSSAFLH